MISCINLFYLHCSDCIYLCLTSIVSVLFIVVNSFYGCVCIYTCTHLSIIHFCFVVYFCLLFIFDYLLFDYCHVYFFYYYFMYI